MRSGVLTGNDTRWRSASSGSPLPEQTDFGPRSLQLDRTTYIPRPATLWPSPCNVLEGHKGLKNTNVP